MKLVIYPKQPKTNKNGRLPVKIFTSHEEEHDYSIVPSKVKSITEILYKMRFYWIIEYDTNANGFDLYKKSSEFAEFLLRNGKVISENKAIYVHTQIIDIAGYGRVKRKIRYKAFVDKDGLKFVKIEDYKKDEEEYYE